MFPSAYDVLKSMNVARGRFIFLKFIAVGPELNPGTLKAPASDFSASAGLDAVTQSLGLELSLMFATH